MITFYRSNRADTERWKSWAVWRSSSSSCRCCWRFASWKFWIECRRCRTNSTGTIWSPSSSWYVWRSDAAACRPNCSRSIWISVRTILRPGCPLRRHRRRFVWFWPSWANCVGFRSTWTCIWTGVSFATGSDAERRLFVWESRRRWPNSTALCTWFCTEDCRSRAGLSVRSS